MKKFCLLFAIFFVTVACLAQAQDTWVQKANFGGIARIDAAGFSIGTKGYIGTGINHGPGTYFNDFWEYDPAGNTWTQKANFGGAARRLASGFSIGTKGYLGTGFNDSGSFNDLWEYDPSNNSWTQKASINGAAIAGAVGFSIGTKGYIGAGGTNDFWEYDQTSNTWTQKASYAGGGNDQATGFAIGTKGYIGTGYDGNIWYKDFWEYDPAANAWTQKADFGGDARYQATGFAIGTKGYIGTGRGGPPPTNDLWEYDQAGNTWTQKANYPVGAPYEATGFSIGTKGYIGVGFYNANNFWEYTPSAIPTVVTGIVSSSSLCAGSGISVPYTVYNTFNSGNVFTAQLSNASGSFASAANIGSVTSISSGTISAVIPANTPVGSGYRIRVMSSNPVIYAPDNGNNIIITLGDTLNLKFFTQGYYVNGGTLKQVLYNEVVETNSSSTNVDTVVVELHNTTAPYAFVESYNGVLQTNGTLVCYFSCNITGLSYYVAVRHRNTVQTWSAAPIAFSTATNYDFTTAQTQAYGNNMIQMEPGKWAFYTGDINQDENVDLQDFPPMDYGINNGLFGYYSSDLNGDGNVDLQDFPILDANINLGIFSQYP